MKPSELLGSRVNVQGTSTVVDNFFIEVTPGDTESLPARIAALIAEAAEAWRGDPDGPIRFHEVMIGRQFTGFLPSS